MLEPILHALAIAVLTFLLALFSYVYRLYQERGREASRRRRENIEHFHDQIEPRLKMDRRRGVQTFGLLAQLTMVLVALAIGYMAMTFQSPGRAAFETAFFVVLEILLVYQFVPYLLMSRSRGNWLLPLVPVLRGFGYAVTPLLVLYGFCVSLLHLAESEEPEEPEPPEQAIEELVEEGQERGILEKEDVPLIASVLQFADKTVREVMTPRPEVVGIAATATLAELRQLIRERRFSRVPVFGENLDDVQGVVFIRDLLEVPDGHEARRQVREIMRSVVFVPETKPVIELVRDLQREMQSLAVVVDEYGNVAGLITLEDLAEEIIGEINDADQVRRDEIIKESDSSYLVRGGVPLDRLRETLGIPLNGGPVTTFAGLVHAWFGYVPKPGEKIERHGLKVEVLEATPRRVVRLRVSPLELAPAVDAPAKKSRWRSRAR
ncbi:MAG: hemolysin family protein [Candidatus Acidoferrales bacterium]